MHKTWSIVGTAFIVCTCATQTINAQSAPAEALFQDGKALMKAAKYDQACPKLQESFRQDPATGALLALAMCHEKQGKLATAWAEYSDVVSRSKQENRKDRADAARKAADALRPRLSELKIDVNAEASQISDLEIKLDGANIGSGAWGIATPIDGGHHKIEATASAHTPWSIEFDVNADADKQIVNVPALLGAAPVANEASGTPPTPAQAGMQSNNSGAEPKKSGGITPLQMTGIVAGSAGIIGLGLGTYFGMSAISGKKDTDSACTGQVCTTTDAYNKRQDAVKSGKNATIAFVTGGVLVATGATFILVGGHKSTTGSAVQASLTPVVGPRDVAFMLAGNF